jgi:hypothetical protein
LSKWLARLGRLDEEAETMAKPAIRDFIHMARQAGYQVADAEQLRPNRWLLILADAVGRRLALLVQARPLISSADVLDLADIVRLRQLHSGVLLAYEGSFSPTAQRTHQVPLASKSEYLETQPVGAAIKSTL